MTRTHDPFHALRVDGVGMTDLVKRATPRADSLTRRRVPNTEPRALERLVAWLEPGAVCFVGLSGYRAAVDRKAAVRLAGATVRRPARLRDAEHQWGERSREAGRVRRAPPSGGYSSNVTSRLRKVGGPSASFIIFSANALTSGVSEFFIATSYDGNSTMLR